jgi:multidrug efflux pump subunit AcrB
VALVSEAAPYRELETWADRLKKRFEATPGVKESSTWGIPDQEVRVSLDLERLAALGLSPLQIVGAIQATNVNIPGGAIDAGGTRLSVKTSGDYATLDEIRDTVVAGGPAGTIRLRDVADVRLGDGDPKHIGRYNGRRAAFVSVAMKDGQDLFPVRAALGAHVDTLRKELPAVVRADVVFDQSENVSHRLRGFARDFVIAIVLVLVTLLPLGLRASGVVMISIPLSLAIGLTLLRLAGFSVNQLSIVGFVIALGLLVDDSIVVVENIARHLREGKSPVEAAIAGTEQIAVSVLEAPTASVRLEGADVAPWLAAFALPLPVPRPVETRVTLGDVDTVSVGVAVAVGEAVLVEVADHQQVALLHLVHLDEGAEGEIL